MNSLLRGFPNRIFKLFYLLVLRPLMQLDDFICKYKWRSLLKWGIKNRCSRNNSRMEFYEFSFASFKDSQTEFDGLHLRVKSDELSVWCVTGKKWIVFVSIYGFPCLPR